MMEEETWKEGRGVGGQKFLYLLFLSMENNNNKDVTEWILFSLLIILSILKTVL